MNAGEEVTFRVDGIEGDAELEFIWYVDGVSREDSSFWLVLQTDLQDPSVRTVEVYIFSGGAEFTTLVWKVHVLKDPAPNAPPSISAVFPPGPTPLVSGETLELAVVATDPDPGDTLTYLWSMDGWPATAGGDTLLFKTTNLSPGDHRVTAAVHDGQRPPDSGPSFTWTLDINPVPFQNRPPLIVSATPVPPLRMISGSSMVLSVEAQDPDEDLLTYHWTVSGSPRPENKNSIQFHSSGLDPGLCTVQATADDGFGTDTGSSSFTWQISVVPEEMAPGMGSVNIAWDPVTTDINGDPEIVRGYLIYLGETPDSLRFYKEVRSSTQATLRNLSRGRRYFIAVSAYDASGNESALSAPISVAVPSG